MADILIRSVPDELHEALKRLAQKHHRSLPAETIHLIEQAVSEEDVLEQRRAAVDRIAERVRHLPPTPPGTPTSLEMLREDRDR